MKKHIILLILIFLPYFSSAECTSDSPKAEIDNYLYVYEATLFGWQDYRKLQGILKLKEMAVASNCESVQLASLDLLPTRLTLPHAHTVLAAVDAITEIAISSKSTNVQLKAISLLEIPLTHHDSEVRKTSAGKISLISSQSQDPMVWNQAEIALSKLN